MDRKEMMAKIGEKLKVEGRTSLYNPLLQKPTALYPVGPGSYPAGLGGYAYIGPPPDFGGSYGAYTDGAGRKQVGIKSSKMFSIYDGTPAQLHSELSQEERDALLSQLEANSEAHKCPHCRSELCISVVGEVKDQKLHCPYCSSVMEGAMEKVKPVQATLEEKKMSEDLAKKAMKVPAPQEVNPHETPKKADGPHALPEAQKQATEIKPMDELAKAPKLVKSEAEGTEEEKKAKAAAEEEAKKVKAEEEEKAKKLKEEEEKKKKEATHAAVERYVARRRAMAVKAKAEKGFDAKTLATLKRELRIMASLEPNKFAALRKNPKLSAVCALVEKTLYSKEVRNQVRAELKALAMEDAVAGEEAKKDLEYIAPEILMEDKSEEKAKGSEETEEEKKAKAEAEEAAKAAAPVKCEEESEEEKAKKAKLVEEEMKKDLPPLPLEEEKEALSMETEYLASLSSLKGDRIEMSLYGEEEKDPFWNLTVDGEPVARIHLEDQKDADQIRAGFVSDSYAENFGNAIAKVGLEKMLTLANAKVFAHRVDDAAITARLRERVKAEVRAEMETKLNTLRSDFLHATQVAMVAANKNFYQEEARNSLKGGLFNALVQAGLTEQHAVWAIEAGFEEAPEYFNFVMDKAVAFMDMPKEAQESLEKTIMNSGKIEVPTKAPEEESLADRLVKSSIMAMAMGEVVSGEHKDEIRHGLGLSAKVR